MNYIEEEKKKNKVLKGIMSILFFVTFLLGSGILCNGCYVLKSPQTVVTASRTDSSISLIIDFKSQQSIQTNYFEIQNSINGKDWNKIFDIPPFNDTEIYDCVIPYVKGFYRLKMTENQKEYYSKSFEIK